MFLGKLEIFVLEDSDPCLSLSLAECTYLLAEHFIQCDGDIKLEPGPVF